jgi:hypothetical protein
VPERTLAATNALPVLVRPTVTVGAVSATEIRLTVAPPLFPGQRATVVLQTPPGTEPARTVSVQLAPLPHDAAAQPTVVLDRPAVPDGTWLVRIQVDGADSRLELVGETYGAPELVLS